MSVYGYDSDLIPFNEVAAEYTPVNPDEAIDHLLEHLIYSLAVGTLCPVCIVGDPQVFLRRSQLDCQPELRRR